MKKAFLVCSAVMASAFFTINANAGEWFPNEPYWYYTKNNGEQENTFSQAVPGHGER